MAIRKNKAPRDLPPILDSEENEDAEEMSRLPPAPIPKKVRGARANGGAGTYLALVTFRVGEVVHKAGSRLELDAKQAAEYLEVGAVRAA